MEFWKKHTKCRIILMAALFIAGISLFVFGWGMTVKIKVTYNRNFQKDPQDFKVYQN